MQHPEGRVELKDRAKDIIIRYCVQQILANFMEKTSVRIENARFSRLILEAFFSGMIQITK